MNKIRSILNFIIYDSKYFFPQLKRDFLLISFGCILAAILLIEEHFIFQIIFFMVPFVIIFFSKGNNTEFKQKVLKDIEFLKNNIDKVVVKKFPTTNTRNFNNQTDLVFSFKEIDNIKNILSTKDFYDQYNNEELANIFFKIKELLNEVEYFHKQKRKDISKKNQEKIKQQRKLKKEKIKSLKKAQKRICQKKNSEEGLLNQQNKNISNNHLLKQGGII